MLSWREFGEAEPELAAHGERLLGVNRPGSDYASGLGYLATVRKDGGPRIHPISPALLDGKLYAFILRTSPKRSDLLRDGRYALHSFPYPLSEDYTDEELYIAGRAARVDDANVKEAVANACLDDVEQGEVFELLLERVLRKSRDERGVIYTKWIANKV